MLDFFFLTRFFVDWLWEYKALSIAHVVLFAALAMVIYLARPVQERTSFKLDGLFLLFVTLVTIPFAEYYSEDAVVDYLKFISYFFAFFYGSFFYKNQFQLIATAKACPYIIMVFLAMAVTGHGYQVWGKVNTFCGGYFFKNDMALSVTVLLIFILLFFRSTPFKLFFTLISMYLVFKTNARMYLAIISFVPILYFSMRHGLARGGVKWSTIIWAGIVSIGLTAGVLYWMSTHLSGYLSFDFSDGFSESNSQGRSVIWASLMVAYLKAGLFKQIFGMGLHIAPHVIDVPAGKKQLQGMVSHNSYLYMLLGTGVSGLLCYLVIMWSWIRRSIVVMRYNDPLSNRAGMLCLLLMFVSLISGLFTDAVVRAQISIPLWLSAGMVMACYRNRKQILRNNARTTAGIEAVDTAA
jgi:hypothetical protein